MAAPFEITFWFGLLFIALGTGLLKPNISAMVGDLYEEEDTRRDAGFSIFYMGINIGSFRAPLVTGFAAQQRGFHWGFAIAGTRDDVRGHPVRRRPQAPARSGRRPRRTRPRRSSATGSSSCSSGSSCSSSPSPGRWA